MLQLPQYGLDDALFQSVIKEDFSGTGFDCAHTGGIRGRTGESIFAIRLECDGDNR